MKGWTVRTEATKNGSKGVASREVYLSNSNHSNHRNTERITTLFGHRKTMSNIAYAGEAYAVKQAANGKGGRPPSSFAMEFTLNLPKGYRPKDEQWQQVVRHCLKELALVCDVKPNQIANTALAILHQQKQETSQKGTGDHCHLVIGKFTLDGTYLRNLQKKTATARVKQAFNAAVKHYCGYDWTEYAKTLQAQHYPNQRAVPSWRVKAAREREAIKALEVALGEKSAMIERQLEDLERKESELLQFSEDLKLVKQLVAKFDRQVNRWLEAHEQKDMTQRNRQENRLKKTLLALDALGALSDASNPIELAVTLSRLESGIKRVNEQKPKSLSLPTRKPRF